MRYKNNLKHALNHILLFSFLGTQTVFADHETVLESIDVSGQQPAHPEVQFTNPVSSITALEAQSINAVTIEDFLKYEPGLIVRRRYIGDPNGVLGIRGSNMFQTARSMVFADGLPLHYHLQTRFSGSPRWSLVSSNETESVETVYGPFSSLYSGNAMGGVINIKTRFPEKFEFTAEASTFIQDFEFLGDDDEYFGHKEFVSIGNKFGDLSVLLSHTHLENESQPMTFFDSSTGGGTTVTGAFITENETSDPTVYFGDSGTEEVTTDLTKIKLGYDIGDWFANLTLAYEDRERDADSAKTYIRDAGGNPVFSGTHTFNGIPFTVSRSLFRVSFEDRETFLIGGELSGPLANSGWNMALNFSIYDVIKDKRLRSDENPADPTFDASGRVREFDDTGWETFDLKLSTDHLFNRDDMRLTVGYHYDHYQLEAAEYTAIGDFRDGVKGALRGNNPSAGETMIHAGFAEFGWQFMPLWDLVLGARYEAWESSNGQRGTDPADFFADRDEEKISPKFALGFTPEGPWSFRYSAAKAYRFPLAEELFLNEDNAIRFTIANADLKPEDGTHHNFAINYDISGGNISVNVFREKIKDVIFNQLDLATLRSTFLNIDEVTTTGAEFVYNQNAIFGLPLDIRSNVAYTDAEVTKNSRNPATVGSEFPRLPQWRGNLLATYHATSKWDLSMGIRFAGDSHGQLDNSDDAERVFGAQDEYIFVDLKTNYRFNDHIRLSGGVENVNNEEAFVFHPWPQRTYFLEGVVKF